MISGISSPGTGFGIYFRLRRIFAMYRFAAADPFTSRAAARTDRLRFGAARATAFRALRRRAGRRATANPPRRRTWIAGVCCPTLNKGM